jgi:hypothetical protein
MHGQADKEGTEAAQYSVVAACIMRGMQNSFLVSFQHMYEPIDSCDNDPGQCGVVAQVSSIVVISLSWRGKVIPHSVRLVVYRRTANIASRELRERGFTTTSRD